LPCQSHYIIDHGKIQWARRFTPDEIRLNRESDRRILDVVDAPRGPWWGRLLRRLVGR
jgi:hypothetical protein